MTGFMILSVNKMLKTVFKEGLFKHKVAIVTGGGTGIGRAITEELLYLGCNVVIASRNAERLEKAVQEIQDNFKMPAAVPPRIMSIPCSIRNEEQVKHLVSSTLKTHGRIDYLVNNGGGQFLSRAADITRKGWLAVIETNLTGSFFMSQEVYKQWMENHGGAIVNILMDNYRGVPLMSHSAAARAGLENLTKSLAIEWAHSGVRVNGVAPGIIYSETAAQNYSINVFDEVKPHLPSKRPGLPAEVSSAVCFLLSPGASFISGTTLHVDCGSRLYSPTMWNIADHNNMPPFKGLDEENEESVPNSQKPKL